MTTLMCGGSTSTARTYALPSDRQPSPHRAECLVHLPGVEPAQSHLQIAAARPLARTEGAAGEDRRSQRGGAEGRPGGPAGGGRLRSTEHVVQGALQPVVEPRVRLVVVLDGLLPKLATFGRGQREGLHQQRPVVRR